MHPGYCKASTGAGMIGRQARTSHFTHNTLLVHTHADISAADVKALRKQTGAGMMDCKKALAECEGDADKAVEVLLQ